MMKQLLILLACTALTTALGAHASLVSHDSQFGVNTQIEDTATGLSYLRLDLTLGMTYTDVAAQLGAGGTFEGYHAATFDEMLSLVSNVVPLSLGTGLPLTPAQYRFYTVEHETDPATVFRAINFTTLFGIEPQSSGEYFGATLFAEYGLPGNTPEFCAVHSCYLHTLGVSWTLGADSFTGGTIDTIYSDDGAYPNVGTLLVMNPVPEPAINALMAAGLVALGVVLRRRKVSRA